MFIRFLQFSIAPDCTTRPRRSVWGRASLVLPLCLALTAGHVAAQPASADPQTDPLGEHISAIRGWFDEPASLELVAGIDQYFRVRGNAGYEATLDLVASHLAGCSDDWSMRRLDLGGERETWTPVRASLALVDAAGVREALLSFSTEADPDRAMLLVGSRPVPAQDFPLIAASEAEQRTSLEGMVVVVRSGPSAASRRFIVERGAAGVIVLFLDHYHRADEHPDVAQFGYLDGAAAEAGGFGFSVSPAIMATLESALREGEAFVSVDIDVTLGRGFATTLEARIPGTGEGMPIAPGSTAPPGPVAFFAHVDEPGANDNASGVAALAELACALRRGLDSGQLTAPDHPIVFVWGQEYESSGAWLAHNPSAVGLVFDMVGADPEQVGATMFIERMPDPGALWVRPPDEHSEWGSTHVSESQLRPHFLTAYAIAAYRYIAAAEPEWVWADHPFEGGSDHESFLNTGRPGLLLWSFTDDAYHTNRDRLDRVSATQMARAGSAFGALALGLASPSVEHALRAMRALDDEATRRLAALRVVAPESLRLGYSDHERERRHLEQWRQWYLGAAESVAQWAFDPEVRAAVDLWSADWSARVAAFDAELLTMQGPPTK